MAQRSILERMGAKSNLTVWHMHTHTPGNQATLAQTVTITQHCRNTVLEVGPAYCSSTSLQNGHRLRYSSLPVPALTVLIPLEYHWRT